MFQVREAERLRKGIDYLEKFLGSGTARPPLSNEPGTYKRVKAGFWPWLVNCGHVNARKGIEMLTQVLGSGICPKPQNVKA